LGWREITKKKKVHVRKAREKCKEKSHNRQKIKKNENEEVVQRRGKTI